MRRFEDRVTSSGQTVRTPLVAGDEKHIEGLRITLRRHLPLSRRLTRTGGLPLTSAQADCCRSVAYSVRAGLIIHRCSPANKLAYIPAPTHAP